MRRLAISFFWASATLVATDHKPLVKGIDSVGLTVSDLDRSVEFYSKVLTFEKVSEMEAEGPEYEHLENVFGLHTRTARMRLQPCGRSLPRRFATCPSMRKQVGARQAVPTENRHPSGRCHHGKARYTETLAANENFQNRTLWEFR